MKSSELIFELPNASRFFIDGVWTEPTTGAFTKRAEACPQFALASEHDMLSAIASARRAYDEGPWPRMHASERAEFLRQIAAGIREREQLMAKIWSVEAGNVFTCAIDAIRSAAAAYESFADMSDAFPMEHPALTTCGKGTRVSLAREPVGVVGAIILAKSPVLLTSIKLAAAMLTGCTVILSAAPECAGTMNVMAEIVDDIAFPPGVINVLNADHDVSELLVNDRRVDKLEIANQKVVRLSGVA